MKKTTALLASLAATTAFAQNAAPAPKPNIIFILADDLGYGDIGVFYQNARGAANAGLPWHDTPSLDRMAAEGAKLTDHYCAAPVSAPSRASFISGLTQGHANVRDNQFDKELADNHTVATVLRRAGYATVAIGKWGLQGKGEAPNFPAHPLNRGFDYYYGYMRHSDGHEHYPKERLYRGGGENGGNAKNQIRVWDNKTDVTAGLDKCYTTDLFAARAKKWIVDHDKSAPGKPFFMYLAFDTPHAVLELPTCPYPAGGGLTGGLQWLGTRGHMINTATGKPDTYIYPQYARATYKHNGKQTPWPDVYKRYATDVRRIDDAVGDLLQLLKDLNIDQNTLVIFTSDNGPSIESYLPERITPQFFSSYGPFDGIKRDMWEGGQRVPAIARWPGKIPAGGTVAAPCAMFDWLPTFAEAAQLVPPAKADGRSLLGNLTGHPAANNRGSGQPGDYLYFEYFIGGKGDGKTPNYPEFESGHRGRVRQQMQALRQGDYLAVRYDIKSAQDDFEIYNVTRDPKEARDLAKKPEGAALQARFKTLALQSRRPDTSAPRPYDKDLIPAVPAPANAKPAQGLSWSYYEGNFPWTPGTAGLTALKTGATTDGLTLTNIPLGKGQNAAVVYQGYLNVPADGDYTFEASTDTGLIMRLHGATVIDADYGYKSGAKRTAKIRLQAGLHPITLTYHTDGKASPALSLTWRAPGASESQPIAPEFFVR